MQKVHNADLGRNYVRCSQPRSACAPESCARLACATHRRIPRCGSQRHCRRRMRTELPRLPISLRQRPPSFGPRPHAANGNLQPPLCGTLNVRPLRWGYPMPSDGKLVFNTRLERAPFSALWSDSFEKRRCIVPVMAFYESSSSEYALNPTGRKVKQTYRFGCGKPAGESSEENLEAAATEHESSVETRPPSSGRDLARRPILHCDDRAERSRAPSSRPYATRTFHAGGSCLACRRRGCRTACLVGHEKHGSLPRGPRAGATHAVLTDIAGAS